MLEWVLILLKETGRSQQLHLFQVGAVRCRAGCEAIPPALGVPLTGCECCCAVGWWCWGSAGLLVM